MSGGSLNYLCYDVEEIRRRIEQDVDRDRSSLSNQSVVELLSDIETLAHDYEWWQSGDISEDAFRETEDEFKDKWSHVLED